MAFDFHVHSVHSDGALTVDELASLCVRQGLEGFALTDHDTISGWREIPVAEEAYGITILPAVELSTEWENRDVHILGFGISPEERSFCEFLAALRNRRVERIYKILDKINGLGMELSYDDVAAESGGSVGRPHVALAMVKKGYVKDIGEAFAKYLERGKRCFVPRSHVTPTEAVDAVVKARGCAVLAHPGLDQAYHVLDDLVDHGLKGLEVYHSSHHPGMEKKFFRMAEEYGLFISAGSDFHRLQDHSHAMLGTKYLEWECMGAYYQQLITERRKGIHV